MITYDKILTTITEILNNDLIYKDGLVLEYTLDADTHFKLNEELYYRFNEAKVENIKFEYLDSFSIQIEDLKILFLKK